VFVQLHAKILENILAYPAMACLGYNGHPFLLILQTEWLKISSSLSCNCPNSC